MKLTTKNLTNSLLKGAMAYAFALDGENTSAQAADDPATPDAITAIDILLLPDATVARCVAMGIDSIFGRRIQRSLTGPSMRELRQSIKRPRIGKLSRNGAASFQRTDSTNGVKRQNRILARSRSAAHLRGFRFMLNALNQDV